MNEFEKTIRCQSHLEITKAATEPQAIISWGEEFLDRAYRVAQQIEEHVRRLLDPSTNPDSCSSVNSSRNSHTGEE